ncbi:MAG: ribonuclease M5 [Myxococcota bacterium]|nr:ribonuclease M5 [Myxococcota bacterium]
MLKTRIAQVIVVEGRDDISAVRRAVDAELIATGGFAFGASTLAHIAEAHRRRGVIVFTDPDTAGEQIRKRIVDRIGPCGHARLPRSACTRNGDIGIENASPEDIRAALQAARCSLAEPRQEFTLSDLSRSGLVGTPQAARRRAALGAALSLGRVSARQLLSRLNHYGVSRAEFDTAVADLSCATT